MNQIQAYREECERRGREMTHDEYEIWYNSGFPITKKRNPSKPNVGDYVRGAKLAFLTVLGLSILINAYMMTHSAKFTAFARHEGYDNFMEYLSAQIEEKHGPEQAAAIRWILMRPNEQDVSSLCGVLHYTGKRTVEMNIKLVNWVYTVSGLEAKLNNIVKSVTTEIRDKAKKFTKFNEDLESMLIKIRNWEVYVRDEITQMVDEVRSYYAAEEQELINKLKSKGEWNVHREETIKNVLRGENPDQVDVHKFTQIMQEVNDERAREIREKLSLMNPGLWRRAARIVELGEDPELTIKNMEIEMKKARTMIRILIMNGLADEDDLKILDDKLGKTYLVTGNPWDISVFDEYRVHGTHLGKLATTNSGYACDGIGDGFWKTCH